jgi:hypothetical protein
MRFDETPPPPHGKHGWHALGVALFFLIMGFVCVADVENWFR